MPDDLESFLMSRPPTPERPLLGQTVLVVEDSRFASEAIRLLSLRSGARIRRADCLKAAHRHLRTYRPTVVVCDIGLPDGSGLGLITELAHGHPRVPAIIATSGDDGMEAAALAAGADSFMAKPVVNIAEFQQAVLTALPPEQRPSGLHELSRELVQPDRIAYRDDLAHAADLIAHDTSPEMLDYLTMFLHGLAKTAEDTGLAATLEALTRARHGTGGPAAVEALAACIRARISPVRSV